jgi:hypothetical protein
MRARGAISPRQLEREWPHQVAIRAEQLLGEHYKAVYDFCRGLSVAPRQHSFRRDDVDYVVFCFGELAHANLFRARFEGERFDRKAQSLPADGDLTDL